MPQKQRDIERGENNNALAQETRRKVRRDGKGKPDTELISKAGPGSLSGPVRPQVPCYSSEEPNCLSR